MFNRFEYKIIDKDRIEIRVNGRIGANGKFVDEFTQKKFEINPKEIISFRRFLSDLAFDYCKKMGCKIIDNPDCY